MGPKECRCEWKLVEGLPYAIRYYKGKAGDYCTWCKKTHPQLNVGKYGNHDEKAKKSRKWKGDFDYKNKINIFPGKKTEPNRCEVAHPKIVEIYEFCNTKGCNYVNPKWSKNKSSEDGVSEDEKFETGLFGLKHGRGESKFKSQNNPTYIGSGSSKAQEERELKKIMRFYLDEKKKFKGKTNDIDLKQFSSFWGGGTCTTDWKYADEWEKKFLSGNLKVEEIKKFLKKNDISDFSNNIGVVKYRDETERWINSWIKDRPNGDSLKERTLELIEKFKNTGKDKSLRGRVRGRDTVLIAAAGLSVACKENKTPILLSDLVESSEYNKTIGYRKKIIEAIKEDPNCKICRELLSNHSDKQKLECKKYNPEDDDSKYLDLAVDKIRGIGSKLDYVPEFILRNAENLVKSVAEKGMFPASKPAGSASAALFLVSEHSEFPITKEELADTKEVTKQIIVKHVKKMKEYWKKNSIEQCGYDILKKELKPKQMKQTDFVDAKKKRCDICLLRHIKPDEHSDAHWRLYELAKENALEKLKKNTHHKLKPAEKKDRGLGNIVVGLIAEEPVYWTNSKKDPQALRSLALLEWLPPWQSVFLKVTTNYTEWYKRRKEPELPHKSTCNCLCCGGQTQRKSVSKKLTKAQKLYYEKNRKKLKTKHIEMGTNRLVFQEEDDDLYTWDDNLALIKVKSCNTKADVSCFAFPERKVRLGTEINLKNRIKYCGFSWCPKKPFENYPNHKVWNSWELDRSDDTARYDKKPYKRACYMGRASDHIQEIWMHPVPRQTRYYIRQVPLDLFVCRECDNELGSIEEDNADILGCKCLKCFREVIPRRSRLQVKQIKSRLLLREALFRFEIQEKVELSKTGSISPKEYQRRMAMNNPKTPRILTNKKRKDLIKKLIDKFGDEDVFMIGNGRNYWDRLVKEEEDESGYGHDGTIHDYEDESIIPIVTDGERGDD